VNDEIRYLGLGAEAEERLLQEVQNGYGLFVQLEDA